MLNSFISNVRAQRGLGINAAYADHLINWAQDLYGRL